MRSRRTVVAYLAAASLAVTALAAAASPSPLALALHLSDLPANVEKPPAWSPSPSLEKPADVAILGVKGTTAAGYGYTWPAGGTVDLAGLGPTPKEWHLTGTVFVAPGLAGARRLYDYGKAAQHGFFSDFDTDGATSLKPPSLGDAQFGLLGRDAGGPQAMVFVRKGSVVWQLRIGHSPSKWTVTKAQVLAQLKTFAAKQKARVAGG
jgi:hypothetical protein